MSEYNWMSAVRFGGDGLVPVVAQEQRTGDVLMVAYADRAALERTAETGFAHYFSRSRNTIWRKGETSGHVQYVSEIRLDCDGDTILYRVDQQGPACHTGTRTCFSSVRLPDGTAAPVEDPGGHVLTRLAATVARRADERPEGSYTAKLLDRGVAKLSQKVGEEAVEVVVAANAEGDDRLASETADLLYHLVVLLQARGLPLDRVWRELENRGK
ncbi:MAG: bifunctional phosphoribosyl-AMP cyclohydrolase/phosphoribosyl-ATP diphosphatase HisIE [Gemmatimonadales bacterium]